MNSPTGSSISCIPLPPRPIIYFEYYSVMARPNVRQAVPFFMVTDIDSSVRFYVDKLGFEMTNSWKPDGKLEWCRLQIGDAALMLQEYREGRRPEGGLGTGVSICFTCDDALAIYR